MSNVPSAEDPSPDEPAAPDGEATLILTENAPRLHPFVARRVPPGIEPDDVIQEVFVRVVRHLPSLREADRIEAWLFQIARNAINDAMRRRQRRDGRTDALDLDIPAEPDAEQLRAAEADLAPCLTPMVARLAEPYRQAIELTSVHGLTQAEAAARAGVSISGMKSRVQRARLHLDRRRGVSDYHPRESSGCSTPEHAAATSARCGAGSCSQHRPATSTVP